MRRVKSSYQQGYSFEDLGFFLLISHLVTFSAYEIQMGAKAARIIASASQGFQHFCVQTVSRLFSFQVALKIMGQEAEANCGVLLIRGNFYVTVLVKPGCLCFPWLTGSLQTSFRMLLLT